MAIQDKFNRPNVIYKITKDIDLGGDTLTIPEGCTLDFQGGSFSNGTIVGNNTAIVSSNTCILRNTELSGRWNVKEFIAEWFGVVGNNEYDTINDLTYLIKALKNIEVDYVEFRKYIETAPTIKFCSQYSYRITSPFIIDIPCNIIGNPLFYYDGDKIDGEGAVIISKQYNKRIEISVTSTLQNIVDLSDNILFGGIKLINVQFCDIKIGSILGFHTGLYLHCKSLAESPNSNNIACGYINHCIHGILVNTINNGYSNANKFYDTLFNGNSNTIVSDELNNGAFIKFIGDGSYGADSILIDNVHIEGKIAGTKNVYFIDIDLDKPKGFGFFEVANCRIERTGDIFIRSNCTLYDMGVSSITYKSNETLFAELTRYNIKVPIEDKILSFFGFNFQEADYTNLLNYKFTEAASLLTQNGQYYATDNYLGLLSTGATKITNCSIKESTVFITYKLSIKKGQIIGIDRSNSNLMFVLLFNKEEKPIFIPESIMYEGFSEVTASTYSILQSYGDGLKYYILNDSDEDYYIYIMSNSDYGIKSNHSIIINKIDWQISKSGNVEDRPILNEHNSGFQFFDLHQLSRKPIWWDSWKWVDANGNDADFKHWGIFADKPNNPEIGYLYYCTDKKKHNSDKYHLPIFYAGDDTWIDTDGIIVDDNYPNKILGNTLERPSDVYVGYQYFDTALNKPIWWTGTKWVDATGTEV